MSSPSLKGRNGIGTILLTLIFAFSASVSVVMGVHEEMRDAGSDGARVLSGGSFEVALTDSGLLQQLFGGHCASGHCHSSHLPLVLPARSLFVVPVGSPCLSLDSPDRLSSHFLDREPRPPRV